MYYVKLKQGTNGIANPNYSGFVNDKEYLVLEHLAKENLILVIDDNNSFRLVDMWPFEFVKLYEGKNGRDEDDNTITDGQRITEEINIRKPAGRPKKEIDL